MADDPHQHVWDMMEKFTIATLVTNPASGIRARPMGATVKQDDDAIYFLTNADSGKAGDIAANPDVTLLFIDDDGQKYVALKGHAAVSNDRATIKEIWTPFAKAWWDGPNDPRIRLIEVTPHSAEYWDSPGKLVSYAKMLTAAVVGGKPEVGENKTVSL